MAIDRIGKGGAPPVVPDAGGAGSAGATDEARRPARAFSVDAPDPARPAAAVDAVASTSPLARLGAGEIDLGGYVDLKVEEATRGLEGLSSSELEDIKGMLREQLTTDPTLGDLVRTATGQAPKPPEE